MNEYVLIFRSRGVGARPSSEQIEARKAWFGRLAADQRVAHPGFTLGAPARVLGGPDEASDAVGPDGLLVTGLMALRAETLDEAAGWARSNPLLEVGGTIEIREVVPRLS